jgi:hypothetical protein
VKIHAGSIKDSETDASEQGYWSSKSDALALFAQVSMMKECYRLDGI